MIIHTVASGETINSIAQIYDVSPELILELNNPPNPDNLVVGQTLVIRVPVKTYTVVEGDTLDSIARANNTTVIRLLQNNPRIVNAQIYPGENIVIEYDDSKERFIVTNGYSYPEIGNELLLSVLPYLTFLTVFTYGFNEDGSLIPPEDDAIIDTARNYGVAPLMLISTLTSDGTFSNELAHTLLNDEALQDILINNIIGNMVEKNYYGLDIDFEFIPIEDRQNYIDFVDKITRRLNAEGFISLVALAPKTSTDQPGLLYESHDYFGLGQVANMVLVMTYEWGYTYGPPMAVSPLDKVEEVIRYAVTQIEPRKMLMGVPLYGYDWALPYVRGESRATSLSPQQAIELAVEYGAEILYDEAAQTPYFYYTDNNVMHVVWFEDARSINAKMGLVNKYGLAGVSYWNLTKEFPQNWQVTVSEFDIAKTL